MRSEPVQNQLTCPCTDWQHALCLSAELIQERQQVLPFYVLVYAVLCQGQFAPTKQRAVASYPINSTDYYL